MLTCTFANRGFSLFEVIISVTVLSFAIGGAMLLTNRIYGVSFTADRRQAVAGELARQLRQAQALPVHTLMNGGDGYDFTRVGDRTVHAVGVEDFFRNTGAGVWWTRHEQRRISSAIGAPKVRVRWQYEPLTPLEHLQGYTITVEVTLRGGNGGGEDMVYVGKAFRTLEAGVNL